MNALDYLVNSYAPKELPKSERPRTQSDLNNTSWSSWGGGSLANSEPTETVTFTFEEFNRLPKDLIIRTFSFLPSNDLRKVGLVNKLWRQYSFNHMLWPAVDLNKFITLNEKDDGNKLLMTILLNISYYNQEVKFQDAPADPSEPSEPNADAEKEEPESNESTPPTDSPTKPTKKGFRLKTLTNMFKTNLNIKSPKKGSDGNAKIDHRDKRNTIATDTTREKPLDIASLIASKTDVTISSALSADMATRNPDRDLPIMPYNIPENPYRDKPIFKEMDDPKFNDFDKKKCGNLTSIIVNYRWPISELSLYYIAHTCPNLKRLDLEFCDYIGPSSIKKLFKSCKHLRSFKFTSMFGGLPQSILEVITRYGTKLREISISSFKPEQAHLLAKLVHLRKLSIPNAMNGLTDETVTQIIKCSKLEFLNIRNSSITDEGLKLLNQLPMLQELDISSCSQLSNTGMQAFCLGHTPYLQRLNISNTPITNQVIAYLIESSFKDKLKELYALGLSFGTFRFEEEAIRSLNSLFLGCSELKKLVFKTSSISESVMASLQETRSNLKIVDKDEF